MKNRVIVSAIVEKGDYLLFGKKPKDVGPYPNTWHVLGGGARLGEESLIEGVKREILEEANIEIGSIQAIGFDEDYEPDKNGEITHYLFIVFRAKYVSGDFKSGDDICELKWVSKKDLKSLEHNKVSIRTLKKIGYW